jgi:RNA recognition motif-containing protein
MFVESQAAHAFYERTVEHGLVIKGKRVKVGWGKSQPLSPTVQQVVSEGGSRNVYIGGLDASITEAKLEQDFKEFGDIELVNIVPDKNIGFVNFTDISSAMKAIEQIKKNPEYAVFKINYGKDRCANPPRPPKEVWVEEKIPDVMFECHPMHSLASYQVHT